MELDEADYSAFDFPTNVVSGNESGLTKRELLAGMALQGLLANPERVGWCSDNWAKEAVGYADKLMAELNKV